MPSEAGQQEEWPVNPLFRVRGTGTCLRVNQVLNG